jgi:hypothetical protein
MVEGEHTNVFASFDFLLNFLIEKSLVAALPSSPAFLLKARNEKCILECCLLGGGNSVADEVQAVEVRSFERERHLNTLANSPYRNGLKETY